MRHEMKEREVKQKPAACPGNGQLRCPRRKAEREQAQMASIGQTAGGRQTREAGRRPQGSGERWKVKIVGRGAGAMDKEAS